MIYCVAKFKAKTGRLEELRNKLLALEPLTHKEYGCIRYTVTKPLKHKYAEDFCDYDLVFNEQWDSTKAFEEHCEKDYIVDFFEKECADMNGSVLIYEVSTFTDVERMINGKHYS